MAMLETKNLTILMTDIKGFTDKTSHRSRADIQDLLQRHEKIVLPILKARGGKLVKTMGDAFLMTFESPTNAVLSGIEVQQTLKLYNEGKSAADRIEVRVAINQGEVNCDGGDVFGEPVNITARIEPFVDAGEVFFTEAIYLSMNKTEVPSSEVGLLQLKGIPEKVKVYKVKRAGEPDAPPIEEAPPAPAAAPAATAAAPSPSSGPSVGAIVFFVAALALAGFLGSRMLRHSSSGAAATAPSGSPAERAQSRSYPSIFVSWGLEPAGPADDPVALAAKQDLIFASPLWFSLRWDEPFAGLAKGFTPESVAKAQAFRRDALRRNPKLIWLADARYTDAKDDFLPPDHPWWTKDASGKRVDGWRSDYHQLDLSKADFQQRVADTCRLMLATGVFDGCLLAQWKDTPEHASLVKKVRAAVGEDTLLMAGASLNDIPMTAGYFNASYIYASHTETPRQWGRLESAFESQRVALREPKLVAVEYHAAAGKGSDKALRLATTFALTHEGAYAYYTEEGAPRRWPSFWERALGQPQGPARRRDDGALERDFENGMAVFNPPGGSEARVRFGSPRRAASSGAKAQDFVLAAGDGELYLR